MENSDNLKKQQENFEEDVFTTPFVKEEKKKNNLSFKKIINNKKKIILIGISIITIFILLFIFFRSGHKDLFTGDKKSIRNYSSGLEATIESILFYLHNDETFPDSIKFNLENILYVDLNFQEYCNLKRLKELLSKRGFVHSIVIESKTYKDFGVNSWIYRTIFEEGDFINVEYIMDFENKSDTIFLKSFEVLLENRKKTDLIYIPPKDSISVKKKKKETEVIIIDSTAKRKVDSVKKVDTKIEEKDKKEVENIEGKKTDKKETEIQDEKDLIKKKEETNGNKTKEKDEEK